MAGTAQCYDRVMITLFGAPYLQNGAIMNFHADVDYNSTLVQGMTTTGVSSGNTQGNEASTITWEEVYGLGGEFVDIVALIRGNPAAATGQLVVQPILVGSGAPVAPALIFTNLVVPRITAMNAPGQGQFVRRNVTLLATQAVYTP